MKRRTFLAASTLSLGALIQCKAAIFSDPSNTKEHHFVHYLDQVGAVSEHLVFLDDVQLEALYLEKSKSLRSLGYQNRTGRFHRLRRHNMAVFRWELFSEEIGVIDISALFFKQNANGEWQYCTTFSGFHFEAITKAVSALSVKPEREVLADLILPVLQSSESIRSGHIDTVHGQLELVIRVGASATTLDFKLRKSDAVLISKIFTTQHTAAVSLIA